MALVAGALGATNGSACWQRLSIHMLAGVCLALATTLNAATPAGTVFVPTQQFTLAWTHSIEKIRWEEDYRVVAGSSLDPPLLHAARARVRGSGAGMEPPPHAVWRNGWYEYQPATAPLQELRLTRSEFTPDYEWCAQGLCQPLSNLLASDGGLTVLKPCTRPSATEGGVAPTAPAG